MGKNNNNRRSFFAEKRSQNIDYTYYSGGRDIDEIERNVCRVIKDINRGNMEPQDYTFFKNPTIVQVFAQECQKRRDEAGTLYHALEFYRRDAIVKGINPYPNDCDVRIETINVNNLSHRYYGLYVMWTHFTNVFISIFNGVNPEEALMFVQNYNRSMINEI